eukprot:SAG31_NODE_2788_length_5089_cov_7.201002_2_plen_146_part_00
MIGNAMGICIGCSFGSLASAQAASPAIIMPLMIFSGFVVNLDSVLPGLAWIQHISPMKYTYQALVNIEFEDLPLRCDHDEIYILSPAFNGTPAVTYCPVSNGNEIIASMSLGDLTPQDCNIFLLVFFLVLRVLAGLLFWRNGTTP